MVSMETNNTVGNLTSLLKISKYRASSLHVIFGFCENDFSFTNIFTNVMLL